MVDVFPSDFIYKVRRKCTYNLLMHETETMGFDVGEGRTIFPSSL
jgi:hypothetical protein